MSSSQKAVLLVNLGSPDSPSVPDVRRYLREFLMDGRVLDAPWPIRCFIVYGLILPFRPRRSAEAYQKIWQPEGSPLVILGRKVQQELQRRLGVPVELAMRYQNPSIPAALRRLRDGGIRHLCVIPMFPHYAMSSFETAVERVNTVVRELGSPMSLEVVSPYYDHPDYIRALAGHAKSFLQQPYDHLLFSFHGLPERHLHKSDPTGHHCLQSPDCCEVSSPALATCYRAQCFRTVAAFAAQTGIPNYSVAFQSRLGRQPWLKPYTDFELPRLAQAGVKRLLVMCPAFVADCLETLEEIGLRGRETFLAAGGRDLTLIPCLNDNPLWLDALEKMATAGLARVG
jgi:protoporphyrin/coproporphyrin ferrochelatase